MDEVHRQVLEENLQIPADVDYEEMFQQTLDLIEEDKRASQTPTLAPPTLIPSGGSKRGCTARLQLPAGPPRSTLL